MMKIYLNGEPREVPAGCTVAQLVDMQRLAGKRLAVEVDLEIVPRSTYAQRVLRDGERVEIVHAIGGG